MSVPPTEKLEAGEPDPICEVVCFDCSVPLPRPLLIGPARVTHRSYALVRIRTESGQEGAAYAFGRGLPVAALVTDSLVPLLLGLDAGRPEVVRHRLAGAFWPYAERGLFPVATSAIDLALWDMLGKRAGLPLADLLGRSRARVRVCAVGGYKVEGADGLDALQSEMAGFLRLGCTAVKVTIGADEPAVDVRRLAAVREVIGPDCALVVDAFRSFTSLGDALSRVRPLVPFDLAYLEDPFSESLAPLVAELRRQTGLLIGLGENLAGARAFRELLASGCVDVVRCDATVVGGVREFMAASALSSAHGLELSAHVHANIHVHFGAAIDLHPAGLEYMAPESGLDGLDRMLATPLEVVDGHALLPERPGLGIDWDWAAVARYARG